MLFVINFFTFFIWVIFTMIALISEDAHWAIWIIASRPSQSFLAPDDNVVV